MTPAAKKVDLYAASDAQNKAQRAFGPPDPKISQPVDMKQGVEAQARAAMPAPNPVTNTTASDSLVALGRNPSIQPVTPAAAKVDLYAAPAPQRQADRNPLGGMDPRGISERGPTKVGSGQPTGMRLLERAARRRNMPAIAQLAQIESRTQGPASWEDRTFGSPRTPRPQPMASQAPDIFAATPTAPAATDPNADFWNTQQQNSAAFQASRATQDQATAEATAKSPTDIFAMQGAGGYVPMVRNADGTSKAAGGFYPGAAPDPNALPALPTTPDQIATKAQQEEQFFAQQGLKLQPPQKATDSAGRNYERPQEPDQIAVNEAGKTMKIPPGFDAPAGFTFLKPKATEAAVTQAPANGQTTSGNTFKRKA
jgi:hypothetical protein